MSSLGPKNKVSKSITFDFLPVLENPHKKGKVNMKTQKEIVRVSIKPKTTKQVFYKI